MRDRNEGTEYIHTYLVYRSGDVETPLRVTRACPDRGSLRIILPPPVELEKRSLSGRLIMGRDPKQKEYVAPGTRYILL